MPRSALRIRVRERITRHLRRAQRRFLELLRQEASSKRWLADSACPDREWELKAQAKALDHVARLVADRDWHKTNEN